MTPKSWGNPLTYTQPRGNRRNAKYGLFLSYSLTQAGFHPSLHKGYSFTLVNIREFFWLISLPRCLFWFVDNITPVSPI